jgi:hypothetical protein
MLAALRSICCGVVADGGMLCWAVQVMAVGCGNEHAGAYTSDGQLLLWGKADHMPPSLLKQQVGQAQQQQQQQQQQRAGADSKPRPATLQVPEPSDSSCNSPTAPAPPSAPPHITDRPSTPTSQRTATSTPQPENPSQNPSQSRARTPLGRSLTRSRSFFMPKAGGGHTPQQQPASQPPAAPAKLALPHFSPGNECIRGVACGAGHALLLAEPTLHVPTVPELRKAMLSVLHAYIRWWGHRPPPPEEGAPRPLASELPLHGVLLVARELRLVDNVTHHTDVIKAFKQVR